MLNTRRSTRARTLVFVGLLGLVLAPTLAVAAPVAPPQSHPHGRSYAEWAAAWWQWGPRDTRLAERGPRCNGRVLCRRADRKGLVPRRDL